MVLRIACVALPAAQFALLFGQAALPAAPCGPEGAEALASLGGAGLGGPRSVLGAPGFLVSLGSAAFGDPDSACAALLSPRSLCSAAPEASPPRVREAVFVLGNVYLSIYLY